jgi:hypothetical protein
MNEIFDPLDALRDAGCPVDQLSQAQRAVLASLTEAEIAVLASVQLQMLEAEGEVVGHEMKLL